MKGARARGPWWKKPAFFFFLQEDGRPATKFANVGPYHPCIMAENTKTCCARLKNFMGEVTLIGFSSSQALKYSSVLPHDRRCMWWWWWCVCGSRYVAANVHRSSRGSPRHPATTARRLSKNRNRDHTRKKGRRRNQKSEVFAMSMVMRTRAAVQKKPSRPHASEGNKQQLPFERSAITAALQ